MEEKKENTNCCSDDKKGNSNCCSDDNNSNSNCCSDDNNSNSNCCCGDSKKKSPVSKIIFFLIIGAAAGIIIFKVATNYGSKNADKAKTEQCCPGGEKSDSTACKKSCK